MRTERRTAGRPGGDTVDENSGVKPAKAPRPQASAAELGPRHTPGSRWLVARHPSPVPLIRPRTERPAGDRHTDAQKIFGALQDQSRQPGPLPGAPLRTAHPDASAVRNALERQSRPKPPTTPRDTPARPAAPHEHDKPARLDGGPQPAVAVRFEAYRRLDALDRRHDQDLRHVGVALKAAEARLEKCRALRSDDARHGVFREGISDAVWAAERDITHIRAVRRDLNVKFGAAKHELECIVGTASGASARQGLPRAPEVAFKSFEEKLAAYNRSVDAIKSSGAIAPFFAAAYALDVELVQGRSLTSHDRDAMGRIYSTGKLLDSAVGIFHAVRNGAPSGAAPPAPGVDYRNRTGNQSQPELWQMKNVSTR